MLLLRFAFPSPMGTKKQTNKLLVAVENKRESAGMEESAARFETLT